MPPSSCQRHVHDAHRSAIADLDGAFTNQRGGQRHAVGVDVCVEDGRDELTRGQERVRLLHRLGDVACGEVPSRGARWVDDDVDLAR